MATGEIYIENLKIEDFGPFYGSHIFDFSAVDDRRAILIGGKNGAGKTHLLRAIYLAVVGETGAVDLKKAEAGSEATKFDVRESLNRRSQSEGKTTSKFEITLNLRDTTGSTGRCLTLFREIRHRPNSPPIFTSQALLNDDRSITDDQEVQKLRDTFLPRHLVRFFFFDAERSQSVQLNERDITEGISRVLGLHSYTELEDDLSQLISVKIPQRYGAGSEKERELNKLVAEIQRKKDDLTTYYSDIRDKELEVREIQNELTEIEEQLQSMDAVDPEELSRLNEQRDAIKDSKSRIEAELGTAWEGALPVALLGELRRKLYTALEKEERRRDWENRKSSVEPKIPKIKREVFDNVPEEHALSSSASSFYKHRLEEALRGLFHPPEQGIADKIFIVPERNEQSRRIRHQLTEKPAAVRSLAELSLDLDRKTADLRETDQQLKQLNHNPAALQRGNELRERRGALSSKKENLTNEYQQLKDTVHSLEEEIKESKRRTSNLNEEVQKLRKGKDLRSLAHNYREAAAEIKKRAAIQLRDKISHIVGDLWLDIAERAMEYRGLKFDKHWNCSLIKPDGTALAWEAANTSAGQRQVRILAFTEALRRLARFVPPLVVDTPLGRLDREVKANVLERLYLSGHQNIILTTNSEVDPDSPLFKDITPKLARVYTLIPEGDEDSQTYHVQVSEDYFKRVL